jgi:hypothetical protein
MASNSRKLSYGRKLVPSRGGKNRGAKGEAQNRSKADAMPTNARLPPLFEPKYEAILSFM